MDILIARVDVSVISLVRPVHLLLDVLEGERASIIFLALPDILLVLNSEQVIRYTLPATIGIEMSVHLHELGESRA